MPDPLPALSLAAVPGRRRATLDLVREIENRGFPGIYCPSLADGVSLCGALAQVTQRVRFGTSIPLVRRGNQDADHRASVRERLTVSGLRGVLRDLVERLT